MTRSCVSPLAFPVALALGFALACGGSKAPPPPSTPAPTDGSIGVPECDDYITKMQACIDKMDPTTKAQYDATFKSTRDAWVQAATNPAARDGLKVGCQSALSAIPTNCGPAPAPVVAPVVVAPVAAPVVAPVAAAPATAPKATTTTSHGSSQDNRTNARSPSLQEIRKKNGTPTPGHH